MRPNRCVLLALGNDILGDDAVGLLAARALKEEFRQGVDIVESSEAGLALMEMLEGYERALLLDAIKTGRHPSGTILCFTPGDFQKIVAPSPHYAGIPEVLAMAKRLGLVFPTDLRILAMEVENPYEVKEGVSPSVAKALPDFIQSARQILEEWKNLAA